MDVLFDRLAPALQSLGRAGPHLLSGAILLTHRPSLSKSSWELAPRYVVIPVSLDIVVALVCTLFRLSDLGRIFGFVNMYMGPRPVGH
jgi:hypothetical protein